MKNILIYTIIFIGFSLWAYSEDINECKTDIYYGNGVWNEPEEAAVSQLKLQTYVIESEIINGDSLLQAKYGEVKLAYNTSFGKLGDVLEVYYQLKQAGQLDGIGFYLAIAALTIYQPHITLGAIATQKLSESLIQEEEEANVDVMWEKYYNESFKLGHRVLLVSHSQGNLFANRIHEKITSALYQDYFANFQVASPASEVSATKGGYVTLYGDPIINPIPRSMRGNANGSPGHAFVEAYLNQIDPYGQIVEGIKQLLPTLDSEISQWETNQESQPNTCESKITVKHRFDLGVEMPLEVYPFNASKKLYQVNGEYVKASCGGENILEVWDGKQENECLMIDNVEKEKISRKDVPSNLYSGCYISGEMGIHSTSSGAATNCNSNNSIFKLTCFSSGNEGLVMEVDPPCMGVNKGGASFAENLDELVVILDEWWQGVHSGFKATATSYTESQHQRILDEYGKDTYEVSDIYSFKTCKAFRGGIGCSYYTPTKVYKIK